MKNEKNNLLLWFSSKKDEKDTLIPVAIFQSVAAEAIGCEVAQIAKSLIFKGKRTQKPILVIASGANRVNENRIQEYVGEEIK